MHARRREGWIEVEDDGADDLVDELFGVDERAVEVDLHAALRRLQPARLRHRDPQRVVRLRRLELLQRIHLLARIRRVRAQRVLGPVVLLPLQRVVRGRVPAEVVRELTPDDQLLEEALHRLGRALGERMRMLKVISLSVLAACGDKDDVGIEPDTQETEDTGPSIECLEDDDCNAWGARNDR